MPANVEIKAKVDENNVDWLIQQACVLAKNQRFANNSNCTDKCNGVHHHEETEVTVLEQTDTFFNCVLPGRRLKLREQICNGQQNKAQLIVYFRPDQTGPKFCDYTISRFDQNEAEQLKSVLKQSLGIRGEVVKTRKVVMVGQTRVHVDQVKDLGSFMELEVVLRDDQTAEEGQQIAEDIMKNLNIPLSNLVAPAYMDLLLQKTKAC